MARIEKVIDARSAALAGRMCIRRRLYDRRTDPLIYCFCFFCFFFFFFFFCFFFFFFFFLGKSWRKAGESSARQELEFPRRGCGATLGPILTSSHRHRLVLRIHWRDRSAAGRPGPAHGGRSQGVQLMRPKRRTTGWTASTKKQTGRTRRSATRRRDAHVRHRLF